ncbi:hypothetical protein N7486_008793 [Penicillium sp. IBT 16267x]|nr:hypothetical protein N7486_008793 [Penicillium sp. IBT 16267x]
MCALAKSTQIVEATGSPVTAVHIQAQQELLVEPQTVAQFIGFAFGNSLPNGTRPSSITTLAMEELAFIQGNYPAGSDGESIMNRVMARIGSEEDNGPLCGVGKNIQPLKSRLWGRITPLSDQRWQEKGL